MKIAAGVLAIVAGFIGIIGGFATIFVGAIGEAVEAAEASAVMDTGAVAFFASILIVIFGIVAFFKPKPSGICIVIFGVIAVFAANFFTGPIAVLAGVFGILDARFRKSKQIVASDISMQGAQPNL